MLLSQVKLASAYGAVMAMDGHTGLPLAAPLLTFDGATKPVRYKPNGYCVLTAPLADEKICRVTCPGYAPVECPVALDGNGRFFALIALSPLAGNPRFTRLRHMLARITAGGKLLEEGPVRITFRGKAPILLVTAAAKKGDSALMLNDPGEARLIGQWLALPGKAGQVQIIAEDVDTPGLYHLNAPLQADVPQSSQPAPFWMTETDFKGEVILPHKPHLMRGMKAELEVTCGGKSKDFEADFGAGRAYTIDF